MNAVIIYKRYFIAIICVVIVFAVGVVRGNSVAGPIDWGGLPIQGIISKPPYETGLYQVFELKVKDVKQTILITASRYPRYRYGDAIGLYEYPPADMRMFLPTIVSRTHVSRNIFFRTIYEIRERLLSQTSRLYPDPFARLVMGIAFGVRMDLGDVLDSHFSEAGVTHIMVASGYNVTVIVGAVWAIISVLGGNKSISRAVSIVVVLGFAVLSGMDPPVVRAGVMVVFLIMAEFIGRQYHPMLILEYVAIGMLFIDPLIVDSLSFYLSVGATGAIFVIRPAILKYFRLWPGLIRDDLVTTLSVSMVTVPLIWVWLDKVQLVGLLTNILILWTVPYITFGAALSLLVSIVNMPFASVIAIGVIVLLKYMLLIVEVIVT